MGRRRARGKRRLSAGGLELWYGREGEDGMHEGPWLYSASRAGWIWVLIEP